MAVVKAQGLTKVFAGGRGVFELDFEVEEGEIFGFLGPNAAGKTTTIRLLMGLLKPTSGNASVLGHDTWNEASQVKSKIGFVPGELHLYENLTGAAFLAFLAGFRPPGALARASLLADRYQLDLGQRVKHLSKGNRQKLILISALMPDPSLYLLDEPTSGLDPVMQAKVLEVLRDECGRGKTVFLSSHYLAEVEKVADRVAIVRDGRLVALERVEELRAKRVRHMEVIASSPLTADSFSGLPNVRFQASHAGGRHVELDVAGDLGPLLTRLAALPVVDVVYPPAELESVFLHYFEAARLDKERGA